MARHPSLVHFIVKPINFFRSPKRPFVWQLSLMIPVILILAGFIFSTAPHNNRFHNYPANTLLYPAESQISPLVSYDNLTACHKTVVLLSPSQSYVFSASASSILAVDNCTLLVSPLLNAAFYSAGKVTLSSIILGTDENSVQEYSSLVDSPTFLQVSPTLQRHNASIIITSSIWKHFFNNY